MKFKPRHGYLICQRVKPPVKRHKTLDLSTVHDASPCEWMTVLRSAAEAWPEGTVIYVPKSHPELIVLDGEEDTALLVHESQIKMSIDKSDSEDAEQNPIKTAQVLEVVNEQKRVSLNGPTPALMVPRGNGRQLVH